MTFVEETPSDPDLESDPDLDPSASDAGLPADDGVVKAYLKHSRASRWMHWINFPLLTIMIWSGMRIYWADLRDPYLIGPEDNPWFEFWPDSVNETLGLERRLARGMAFHFTVGWLFTLNGVAFGIYLLRSGEWRQMLPERGALKEALQVTLYDLGIGRKNQLPPQARYNSAQRISYTAILFMGALVVATGFAIYKPTQLSPLTSLFGGYERARTIHFVTTVGFLAFFVIHILQVARAGWGNFMSMITGYELRGPSKGEH